MSQPMAWLIHALIYKFTYSFIHFFIQSFIHSFIHSLIHKLIHSFIQKSGYCLYRDEAVDAMSDCHSFFCFKNIISLFIHSFTRLRTHSFIKPGIVWTQRWGSRCSVWLSRLPVWHDVTRWSSAPTDWTEQERGLLQHWHLEVPGSAFHPLEFEMYRLLVHSNRVPCVFALARLLGK